MTDLLTVSTQPTYSLDEQTRNALAKPVTSPKHRCSFDCHSKNALNWYHQKIKHTFSALPKGGKQATGEVFLRIALIVILPLAYISLLFARGVGKTLSKLYGSSPHPKKVVLAKDERPAQDLISRNRFDLTAKTLYARHLTYGLNGGSSKRVYREHLRTWNNFVEPRSDSDPNANKHSFEDFDNTFVSVLTSVNQHGFSKEQSPVPVSADANIPLDGAHRIAACYTYNKPVRVVVQGDYQPDYSYRYFRNLGLDESTLDAMGLEYCRVKPSLALAVFPSVEITAEKVRELVTNYLPIAYQTEISVTEREGHNFTVTSYYDNSKNSWLGTPQNGYHGALAKSTACFPKEQVAKRPMHFVVLDSNDLDAAQKLKDSLRENFNIGKDSCHITDTQEQTLELAQTVLHENTRLFNQTRKMQADFPNFEKLFAQLKEWLEKNNIDSEKICIAGSAVLSAYGLRDCNDLDVLHHSSVTLNTGNKKIGSENEKVSNLGFFPDQLIFDSGNYFYYRGIKFITDKNLIAIKMQRNEARDLEDLKLFNNLIDVE